MKHLWGIRHVRYCWLRRAGYWQTAWYRSGRYSSPEQYLAALWRGDA